MDSYALFEDIIFNDLDDNCPYNNSSNYEDSTIKYNDNNVRIVASSLDFCYDITTEKYSVVWYVSPTDEIIVYGRESKTHLLQCAKIFDMSYLAEIEDNSVNPGKLEILYSCSELVDKQIDRLLNLKAFL